MIKNMGNADRIIRTIAGIALVAVFFVFPDLGVWRWVAGALGLVFLATSAISTCPLYLPFGISTRAR
jgi:hypothetical protein